MNVDILREILRLLRRSKLSARKIGKLFDLSHTTINKYKDILNQSNLTWQDIESMEDKSLQQYFKATRGSSKSKRLPDWDVICRELCMPGVTRQLLWEEYHDINPKDAYERSRFYELLNAHQKTLNTSMIQDHKAGEKVFIDFAGRTIPWIDLKTNKARKAYLFVSSLGVADLGFGYATPSQTTNDWIEGCVKMFEYYQGTPEVIVLDNAKALVTKAGKLPIYNKNFLKFAWHYDVILDAARVGKPQDKPRGENQVKILYYRVLAPLRHRTFYSIDEINQAILEQLEKLNRRNYQNSNECRLERFEKIDKPFLSPLPSEPYEQVTWLTAQKVPSSYHVRVNNHYYSVPHYLVGSKIEACVSKRTVELYENNVRVATHKVSDEVNGHTTLFEHMDKKHQRYKQITPEEAQRWAESIGEGTAKFVKKLLDRRPNKSIAIRQCGIMKDLTRDHSSERMEAVCQYLGAKEIFKIDHLESTLKKCVDESKRLPVQGSLPLHHMNIRGPHYYSNRGA